MCRVFTMIRRNRDRVYADAAFKRHLAFYCNAVFSARCRWISQNVHRFTSLGFRCKIISTAAHVRRSEENAFRKGDKKRARCFRLFLSRCVNVTLNGPALAGYWNVVIIFFRSKSSFNMNAPLVILCFRVSTLSLAREVAKFLNIFLIHAYERKQMFHESRKRRWRNIISVKLEENVN